MWCCSDCRESQSMDLACVVVTDSAPAGFVIDNRGLSAGAELGQIPMAAAKLSATMREFRTDPLHFGGILNGGLQIAWLHSVEVI